MLFRNRVERIALPLACAWIILFPLVIVASGFAHARSSVQVSIDPNDLTSGRLLNHLMHLWFLYDLLILYGVALLADSAKSTESHTGRLQLGRACPLWACVFFLSYHVNTLSHAGVDA